ncbi:MAG: type II toxin-antitoxin system prevent-host-death family antitoxin [Spirochaetes bacterium]|nr:type II toxin-antitoxin system prevent-host-death family antitoxin [Spirochaetota bacterium]MBN2769306.1 type II toxin-antitoxin system prevent-host-death family antitoxin [Spirochaetota bacterium]
MTITTKELRIQPGRIIDMASNGESITVTYRGRALVRIVPINSEKDYSQNFSNWSAPFKL